MRPFPRYTAAALVALALIVSGCIVSDEDTGRDPTTLYVSVDGDNDRGDGSAGDPFASVGGAVARAIPGDTIAVGPGEYETTCSGDSDNFGQVCDGDQFPIQLLRGMRVVGDPDAFGAATVIRSNTSRPMFLCAEDAVLTGLTLDNRDSEEAVITCSGEFGAGGTSGVTGFIVTRNTIRGANAASGYGILDDGDGTEISENRFTGHAIGIEAHANAIIRGNVVTGATEGVRLNNDSALMENNTITDNVVGIVISGAGFAATPDLGGGALGSAGGNTISCNIGADIQNFNFDTPIFATVNRWDHAPPDGMVASSTMTFRAIPAGTPAGQDILLNRSPDDIFALMLVDGAELAADACP